MASEQTQDELRAGSTCGCGATVLFDEYPDHHAKFWRPNHDNCGTVAVWVKGQCAAVRIHEYGHCRECGRPVGFDPDGTPTVGASYAEIAQELADLKRKAAAFDKLEKCVALPKSYPGPMGSNNGDAQLWERINAATTWLELAEALPETEEVG